MIKLYVANKDMFSKSAQWTGKVMMLDYEWKVAYDRYIQPAPNSTENIF